MVEKKKTKKKNLKIIGICLIILVILFIILILIGNTVKDTSTPSTPEMTGVLPLEEIAEKEGRDIDDFVPTQTNVSSLEEIIKEENGGFEQNNENPKPLAGHEAPEPTNVPPLEE